MGNILYEFIGDFYEDYQAEIDLYVSHQMSKHNIQDEEGIYIDNKFDIDSYDEALQYFGMGWVDEQVSAGRFKVIEEGLWKST